jgi:hypothetical protein
MRNILWLRHLCRVFLRKYLRLNHLVESHAFVVVGVLRCRHPSPVEPPLKGRRYLCGNLLYGNVYG